MNSLRRRLTAGLARFRSDLWTVRHSDLSRPRALLLRQVRIMALAVRGFREDNCPLRASSVTFYSLLSVVPVAAMAFGIAKGFGFEKMLEVQLLERFPGQETVVVQVVTFAHSLLENTRGGMIAGIGVMVLFWSVIKVLSQIESAFNRIWAVEKPRSLVRKFTDYLTIMLICPLLVILSGSVTVFITTQVHQITARIALLGMFSPLIALGLKLIPYVLIWALFTFVYLVMPNTRVRLGAGLAAGILAGTAYQLAQWGYISFQVGMARYNAIYGSFAALPLFIIWLQVSWLIVLAGAEVAFAIQNVDRFEMAPLAEGLSPRQRQLLLLEAAQRIVERFDQARPAATAAELSDELELPVAVVQGLLDDLVASGLFAYLCRDEEAGPPACQPASSIDRFSVAALLEALETAGRRDLPPPTTTVRSVLEKALSDLAGARSDHPANRLLKDL